MWRSRRPGREALAQAADWHPDLVVLDLGLPDIDGVDVIAGLRGWSRVPIIVLSGRSGSKDKVDALDAGADDYVTKPFGIDELLARVRSVTRRVGADEVEPIVRVGRFTVDLANKTVKPVDADNAEAASRRPPDADRVAVAEHAAAQPRQADQPATAAHRQSGDRHMSKRPTTCGSTWRSYAGNSKTTPRIRATY